MSATAMSLTPLRSHVLHILQAEKSAVRAYDLLAKIKNKKQRPAQPPTVYRALEYLTEQGIVHKIHALNAYFPCAHPGLHSGCHLMICRKCQRIEEFCNAGLSQTIRSAAGKYSFHINDYAVEVYGICRDCRHPPL